MLGLHSCERRFSRYGGVEVMDPAAAVAKLEKYDGDNAAVAVDMVDNFYLRVNVDDLPGLDYVARQLARVGGIRPNSDAVAAGVVADGVPADWRGRWCSRARCGRRR